MHTIKSSIPKPIKDKIKKVPLTKFIFKKNKTLTPEQEDILKAKEYLDKPPSVLFFTTHKCASTFVPPLLTMITRNSKYEFKDYAGAIWNLGNQLDIGQDRENFLSSFLENTADRLFCRKGTIYAPLRIPVDFPERKNLKHIFFLRDPRDVLVSSYYSFGFTHAEPKNSQARKRTQAKRELIQKQGIDNYSLDAARNWLLPMYVKYKNFYELAESCLYLRYRDFQNDTFQFIISLVKYLDIVIPEQEIEKLVDRASPIQTNKDNTKHKRSGKSKQYLEELKPQTVKNLNQIFSDILHYWKFND